MRISTTHLVKIFLSAFIFLLASFSLSISFGNDLANLDTDGDGISDSDEIRCGSDPLDPLSKCNRGMPWLMLLLEDDTSTGTTVQHNVTAYAGTGGSVSPATRSVNNGNTASFTVTPTSEYTQNTSVGGTCSSGSWSDNIYITGAITGDCSVSFSFTAIPTSTLFAGLWEGAISYQVGEETGSDPISLNLNSDGSGQWTDPEGSYEISGIINGSTISFTLPNPSPSSSDCADWNVSVTATLNESGDNLAVTGSGTFCGPSGGNIGYFSGIFLTSGGGQISGSTLPDSGQTICYDSSGTVINCAGTGQDGEYSINPLSYTDNGNGTITDHVTGLVWQNTNGEVRSWEDAVTYCNSLNLGGSSNWRLPTSNELMGIVDYGRFFSLESFSPAIDPVFSNTSWAEYWSISTRAGGTSGAWRVSFNDGKIDSINLSSSTAHVRCVQGETDPTSAYTDNGNGTVSDTRTGLIWQQSDDGTTRNWQEALIYCNSLTLGGNSDWRLPNVKELRSIVDESRSNPAIDQIFSGTSSSGYWSSSSSAGHPSSAWRLGFYEGTVGRWDKTSPFYARCVSSSEISGQQSLVTATVGTGGSVTPGSQTVNNGATTSFTVTPNTGYQLEAVGGTCPSGNWSGSTYTTGAITGDCSLSFSFSAIAPITYNLSVSKSGTGSGSVTSSPSGISCGSTCSYSFTSDTSVTLTATPEIGSIFAGWGGACNGAGTCTVTMDAARDVTATFNAAQVATPTFSPTPATYTSAQSVSLGTSTEGASIFYTTDGSTPTASSVAYTGPINVASTTIIKAIAVKSDWADSTVATGNYTITGTVSTPAPLARTGQLTQYATGDDGNLQKGVAWPEPRFTDNIDGTVTDNLTGLIWLTNANCFGTQNWAGALTSANDLASGTCGLNDGSLAGDWRLPNINELESLVDAERPYPALPVGHPFAGVQSSDYWSSTTYAGNTEGAWRVGMESGAVWNLHKADRYYVWPVRGGQMNLPLDLPKTGQTVSYASGDDGDFEQGLAWPDPRFTDNNDGTVTDNLTGLIWLTNANCFGFQNWAEALNRANGLADGACGLSDLSVAGNWRLPNRRELNSLVDYSGVNPALPTGHPFAGVADSYWSSSTVAGRTGNALAVIMLRGGVGTPLKSDSYYVWPVRDGQKSLTTSTLPDTGQTTCYDVSGTVINCAGTGQDGEYSINPLSYTDNGNGTVRDNVTELIWQQSDDGITRTWQGAIDYCTSLTLGGSSNWRLPTRRELIHIVDYGRYYPAINPVFSASVDYYWSSSVADSQSYAWGVYSSGSAMGSHASFSYHVRCVQGDIQPEPIFTDNGNGTVTDQTTNLIWQKTDDGTVRNWQGALNYCNSLNLGGSSSWRLPNIKELESIYRPASDTIFISSGHSYWSASSYASSQNSAWFADFTYGHVDYYGKTGNIPVRCVRSSDMADPQHTVTSPTGRVWMDKNLGATQVATAYDDSAAYGDLYQWGRGTDGHEKRDSPTTTTLSSSDTPGHGSFILAPSAPYDWRNPQNDNLWQGVSGVNNPCPSGFRLPTSTEWDAERATWSTNDHAGAFASPLKLVAAGLRHVIYGEVYDTGIFGYYWSSSVAGVGPRYLHTYHSGAYTYSGQSRAQGLSVRCIKD